MSRKLREAIEEMEINYTKEHEEDLKKLKEDTKEDFLIISMKLSKMKRGSKELKKEVLSLIDNTNDRFPSNWMKEVKLEYLNLLKPYLTELKQSVEDLKLHEEE